MSPRGSLLVRARTRATLEAHRKVTGLLEGGHRSVHAGRSLDFEDLREYVDGDDVKDIDWKATARHGDLLVRRYVAHRQHAVMLVVDTGHSMTALNDASTPKRDVVITVAGLLAQVAIDRGDLVGMVAGPIDGHRHLYVPPRGGERHAERMLRGLDDGITAATSPSEIAGVLAEAGRTMRRRSIVAVVSDDHVLGGAEVNELRRLAARHDLIHVTVADAHLTDPDLDADVRELAGGARLPPFLRHARRAHAELVDDAARRHHDRRAVLGRLGIESCRIDRANRTVDELIAVLERRRRARRHA